MPKPSRAYREKLDEAQRLKIYVRKHGIQIKDLSDRDKNLLKWLKRVNG